MIRVLHLYAGNLFGGVETFLVTLARERALANMTPVFGLCFEGRLSSELRAAGVDVQMLGEVRFSRPWTVWRARANLRRLLAQQQFDVAICHSAWPHAVFAPVVKRANLPLVFWAHSPPAQHWLDRLADRTRPDLLVANSQYTLAEHGGLFSDVRGVVLRCPVPAPAFDKSQSVRQRVRREFDTPDQNAVIVCSSRLEPLKGHPLLLEALAKLKDVPHWSAWIAGGPQRAEEEQYLNSLQAQSRTCGLSDRVKFIGQRTDITRVLAAADIHCQPNVAPDSFGISYVEALYAGLPVVTTQMGGALEIVTEFCGVLVPPVAQSLADALWNLITDADHRSRLGAGAPSRAAELCDPRLTLPAIERELEMSMVQNLKR